MKIYAVRDRLIDYFQQPFAAIGDHEVQAAISQQISSGDPNAISQAPQHFELWILAIVQENGHIEPHRELVCEISSLVRRNVREGGTQGGPKPPETAPERTRTTKGPRGSGRTKNRPISPQAPSKGRIGKTPDPRPGRSPAARTS